MAKKIVFKPAPQKLPAPTPADIARYMKNAERCGGKEWAEVAREFEDEMMFLRTAAGLKDWEYWTGKHKY